MKIKGCIVPSPFKRNFHWPDDDDMNKGKKRRLKEKLPYTVTSQAWREYHKKKEAEKQRIIEEKERKAKERAEKKLLKEKLFQEKRRNKIIRTKIDDTSSDDTETEVQYCETDNSPYELEQEEEKSPVATHKNIKSKKSRKRLKTKFQNLEGSDLESEDEPLSKLSKSQRLSKGTYVVVTYEGEYFPGIIENISNKSFEISTMTFSTGNTFKWPEKPDKIWYQEKE